MKDPASPARNQANVIRLGLIGDNIADSRSPHLHRLAAKLCGLSVDYELLIPPHMGESFDAVLADCARSGFRGVNVTYPYKERAAAVVAVHDARIRSLGGVNTVIFEEGRPQGHNTDYSGFIAAYRHVMGGDRPGSVCLLGAGGVGKAVAFGLLALGLENLRIVERDLAKAEALAAVLSTAKAGLHVETTNDPVKASRRADGLINCTPVGMVGLEGTPLPRELMQGASWAFDAVYTPVDTEFLRNAAAEGLRILSGYELFFYQGIDAFECFTGQRPDEHALRSALRSDHE